MKTRLIPAATFASLLLPFAAAAQTTYTYTQIVVPGSVQTNPIGINQAGEVLGIFYDASFTPHGFTYLNGKVVNFSYPGAATTNPTGINDQGQIVGFYSAPTTHLDYAFADLNGIFTTVTYPGSGNTTLYGINPRVAIGTEETSSGSSYTKSAFTVTKAGKYTLFFTGNPFPVSINNHGTVAGYDQPTSGQPTSFFIDTNGTVTTVPIAGSVFTQPFHINNLNTVVGLTISSLGHQSGFAYRNGTTTLINVPGAASTFVEGNNDTNAVCGVRYASSFNETGFVEADNVFSTLAVPGTTSDYCLGINNAGQAVGGYTDANGRQQVFLAMPVTSSRVTAR